MGMRVSPELERRILELAAQAAVEPHRLGIAPMSEAAFQTQLASFAKRLGWRHYHTRDSRKSEAGFPDSVLVHRVHGLVIPELKVGDNEPTPDQLGWLEDLRAVGVRAPVWRPEDWPEIERVLLGVAR